MVYKEEVQEIIDRTYREIKDIEEKFDKHEEKVREQIKEKEGDVMILEKIAEDLPEMQPELININAEESEDGIDESETEQMDVGESPQ